MLRRVADFGDFIAVVDERIVTRSGADRCLATRCCATVDVLRYYRRARRTNA